jgi:hypothetical protein
LAEYNIGLMYYNGKGVAPSQRIALNWFLKAAKQRAEYAQFLVGEMYANGLGVRQDLPEAYAWLSISADHRFENMEDQLAALLFETSLRENERALTLTRRYQRYANNDLIEDNVPVPSGG